jgi:ABC-type transporter Mla subunit MlaD
MALHDLTPQLRTRLNRVEKVVAWFLTLAAVLLAAGLGFYVYQVARERGWLLQKAFYWTYLNSGMGLKEGESVKLMGFEAGRITKISPESPELPDNVYVEFVLHEPNYGYVWSDSVVKVKSSGFLGSRFLEVTKGGSSGSTGKLYSTIQDRNGRVAAMFDPVRLIYTNITKQSKYHLQADEPVELQSQIDQMVQTAKGALPGILALTNPLQRVLNNSADLTERLDDLLRATAPVVTNLIEITDTLRNPKGSLGEWLIPPELNQQITGTLGSAQTALDSANRTLLSARTVVTNTDQRLDLVVSNLNRSLENLAGLTANLRAQADANTNLVQALNQILVHTDDLVQGLKRHWFLRGAFREKAGAAPPADTGGRKARPPRWDGK